jgi:hypothetical protein
LLSSYLNPDREYAGNKRIQTIHTGAVNNPNRTHTHWNSYTGRIQTRQTGQTDFILSMVPKILLLMKICKKLKRIFFNPI